VPETTKLETEEPLVDAQAEMHAIRNGPDATSSIRWTPRPFDFAGRASIGFIGFPSLPPRIKGQTREASQQDREDINLAPASNQLAGLQLGRVGPTSREPTVATYP
jgi:hypothetical protein